MLLSPADERHLKEALAGLARPVRLVFFTQTLNCDSCGLARRILDEIASAGDAGRIVVEEHNFLLEQEQAAGYGIERVPATAIFVDGEDARVRFYGAPEGYEFASLVDAVLVAGGAESGLSEASRALLARVDRPVSLQVFVTPT
jgi:alkyl hydroperoxide reductase subunit AhpF